MTKRVVRSYPMLGGFKGAFDIKTIVGRPVYGSIRMRKRFENGFVTIGYWLFTIVHCYPKD